MPELESSSLDTRPLAEIGAYQDAALLRLLAYVAGHSPFYQNLFQRHQIDIASVQGYADLARLPFTTKDDLQRHNWAFLCVPKKRVAEYCTTSGTLGMPVTICLTRSDLARLAHNEHLSLQLTGGTEEDIYQLMLTLDRQFMAGIAYYTGALKADAGVIRVGPGNIVAQMDAILHLNPTVLIAVPSFLVSLIRHARESGVDLNSTSVKKIICIGEAIRDPDLQPNALAREITRHWGVQLFSTYASTEKQTAFTECGHGTGNHHQPELLVFEIVDEHGQRLPPGQPGELVITTLGVEGMPLVRYRTGDMCSYYDGPCACGRNTLRLGPILGRRQHLLKLKGTTLYPQALFNVLNGFAEIEGYVVEAFRSEFGTDEVKISLALTGTALGREDFILPSIRQAMQAKLRVAPEFKILQHKELLALQGVGNKRKPSTFLEHRR
jgi:phenylacetate-CoA ligase